MNNKLLSHNNNPEALQNTIEKIKSRIIAQGNLPYVTVEKQLAILSVLSQFEFGQFLLQNQGLNGYLTHYVLMYPWNRNQNLSELEKFLLEKSPVVIATQERFQIFLTIALLFLIIDTCLNTRRKLRQL